MCFLAIIIFIAKLFFIKKLVLFVLYKLVINKKDKIMFSIFNYSRLEGRLDAERERILLKKSLVVFYYKR